MWLVAAAMTVKRLLVVLARYLTHRQRVNAAWMACSQRGLREFDEVDGSVGALPVVYLPMYVYGRRIWLLAAALAQEGDGRVQLGWSACSEHRRETPLLGGFQL